jgi:hypothetical protein
VVSHEQQQQQQSMTIDRSKVSNLNREIYACYSNYDLLIYPTVKSFTTLARFLYFLVLRYLFHGKRYRSVPLHIHENIPIVF